jgi:hypothetical protein
MAEINDLTITDASNTARFPESQAPSTVNNGARALEGLIARGLKDIIDGGVTTAGDADNYTLAANRTLSAYYDGLMLCVDWHVANNAGADINVDSLGAKNLVWPDGTAVAAGELVINSKALIIYDGTSFQVLTFGMAQATQAEMETGTSLLKVVSPGRVKNHPGVAKGWCQADTGGTAVASYNVDSVTDTGTGEATINWDTDFSAGTYCAVVTAKADTPRFATAKNSDFAAGVTTVEIYDKDGTQVDPNHFMVAVFGDQ